MEKIFVKDIIGTSNAIIQKFGLLVFKEVNTYLSSDKPIILSFEGITNITSGFCHASIGNLFQVSNQKASQLLKIEGIHDTTWQEKIDEAISLALNPKKSEELDSAIAELFA